VDKIVCGHFKFEINSLNKYTISNIDQKSARLLGKRKNEEFKRNSS